MLFGSTFIGNQANGQQLKISDFTLFGGPNGTGTTLIGSSITINNGAVGGTKLVQTTGNATINAHIHSGDKVIITNSNVIKGKITAANSSGSAGNILSVGSSASITGNIDVNGNINIGGGSVTGIVTLPAGKTYVGPAPSGGTVFGTPAIPILPVMPAERSFPAAGTTLATNITGSVSKGPGSYANVIYSGNKTLTLDGGGVYVFNSFQWTGNSNILVFKFNSSNDKFYIYVHGNADFGKLSASILNGGPANNIYFEVHGDGTGTTIPGNSFIIANGSSGGGSKMQGTVYATRSGINIGSGTGSSSLTGALYSVTGVTIQSGVTIGYAPFNFCDMVASTTKTDVLCFGNSTGAIMPSPVTQNTSASGLASLMPMAYGRPTPIVPRPPELIQRRGSSNR